MILSRAARLADLSADLRALVHEHGIALLSQPNLLDSLLKDTRPHEAQEALILRAAAQLIGPLLHNQMSARELDLTARRLRQEGHLTADAARWAVQMFAQALELQLPARWSNDDEQSAGSLARPGWLASIGAGLLVIAASSFYVGYRAGAGGGGHPPPLGVGTTIFAKPKLQAIDLDALAAQHDAGLKQPLAIAVGSADEGDPPKRILITRNAPVRPEPSPDASPVVCTLMAGDRVSVLDAMLDDTGKSRFRWYHVPCDLKRSGWVSRNFVAGD